jgi:NAD(P)-dependent dehydrogenase (short-subunit alcohol dehydrogenase family)
MTGSNSEVAPFGIRTMLVEPGFFRTELLTDESTKWPDASIDDYAEKTRQTVTAWKKMNGLQGGDPAKLAKALIQLAGRAPAALARRRRRRRDLREEGQGVACPGRCPPDAVLVARARRRK